MGDPIVEAAARKGSAELLILAALEDGQLHGYDIAREIARRSDGLLTFHVASLYPLLYKLEDRAGSRAAGSRRPASAAAGTTGSPPRAAGRSPPAQPLGGFVAALTKAAGLACLSTETTASSAARTARRPRALRRRRIAKRSTRSPSTSPTCTARASADGTPRPADAMVEAELARMGPLAARCRARQARADRRRRRAW